jgi:adenosylhomocysteine nucleosidase
VRRLGIITGMTIEAACINAASAALSESIRPFVIAVGADPEKAKQAARNFADLGVAGLVSFGVAGGLDPSLVPGDVVLANTVWQPNDDAIPTHAVWRDAVATDARTLRCFADVAVAGSDYAITSAVAKAALLERSGAAVVDMESHGVAVAAQEAGLPFLVVRAVADPALRALPAAALAGIGPNGSRRPFAVFAKLLANPTALPALIRLAKDSNKAMKSLSTIAASVIQCWPKNVGET